jgi:hypothetical protein
MELDTAEATDREIELSVPWATSKSAILVPLAWATVLGLFATICNGLFYRVHEPFHDSMSYHEKIFRAMTLADVEGLTSGLNEALVGNNTTCLPILIAALLGPFLEPTRWVGVWIQVAELLFYLVTLEIYLRLVWKMDLRGRAFSVISIATLAMMFFTNGGLSDFRMDLSLALMYGATVLWALVARTTCAARHFFWLGISFGVCCLFRATAPIYLCVALAPVVLIDLWSGQGFVKRSRRRGWIRAMIIAAITCLWFYVLNFDYLYYYYFVWNTDANAKIPRLESFLHLEMVGRQLGWSFLVLVLGYSALRMFEARTQSVTVVVAEGPETRGIRGIRGQAIRLMWFAAAPLVILIGQRMGLNPFVSMPSAMLIHVLVVIGMVRSAVNFSPRTWKLMWVVLMVSIALALGRGLKKHVYPRYPLMAGHRQLLDAMIVDANTHGIMSAHFASAQMMDYETSSLHSVILFDHPRAMRHGLSKLIDGISLSPSGVMNRPAAVNWQNIKGDSDAARIQELSAMTASQVDYLVVPTKATAQMIVDRKMSEPIHRFSVSILQELSEDRVANWEKIAGPIAGKDGREFELWAKANRGSKNNVNLAESPSYQ